MPLMPEPTNTRPDAFWFTIRRGNTNLEGQCDLATLLDQITEAVNAVDDRPFSVDVERCPF
jgi:hypothetical protein